MFQERCHSTKYYCKILEENEEREGNHDSMTTLSDNDRDDNDDIEDDVVFLSRFVEDGSCVG